MSRLPPTGFSVVLVGVMVLAAHVSVWFVAVVALLVVMLIAAAPNPADARGRSVPTPKTTAVALSGLVAIALTVRPDLLVGADGTHAGSMGLVSSGSMVAVIPAVAVGVFASLVAQMRRSDGRRDLVTSTGYAVALTAFAALTVGWITAVQAVTGPDVVVVSAAATAAALLVWTVPIDRWICGCLAVTAGGAGGAVAAALYDTPLTWAFGITVGVAIGLFAVLGQVVGRAWAEGRRHAAAGWGFPAALSVALVAPIVHVGAQLVTAF